MSSKTKSKEMDVGISEWGLSPLTHQTHAVGGGNSSSHGRITPAEEEGASPSPGDLQEQAKSDIQSPGEAEGAIHSCPLNL